MNKLFAQALSTADWEENEMQFMTEEETENKVDWSAALDELQELREHPLNINMATKTQLERFPFLSDLQIEKLLYYIYVCGPMKTIYELQLVEEMDRETIQYLLPFVCAGKVDKSVHIPSFKALSKYGKHEATVRFDLPLNKKNGYRSYPDSILLEYPDKQYLGMSFYHSFRYGFRYKDFIYWGLTAEKDAGEPFFWGYNKKGYDYYSFYLYVRDLGHLKALAVGNYKVSFGQGLVISTDYSLGKSSSISTVHIRRKGISKHSSTDEYNYFRGMAASYQFGCFLWSGFYSHRKLDATVNNGFITSIKTDGIHRVNKDFDKRNNITNQVIGSNLTFSKGNLHLGLTAVYTVFNKVLKYEVKPYSVFYPEGKTFFNTGIHYSYRWKNVFLFGETAVGKEGRVATLNGLELSPLSGYKVTLLQRSYSKSYQSLFARSISEGGDVRNEKGFYLGMEAKPVKYWKLFAYADWFQFPWLKYRIDKPSSGFDGLLQASYSPKQNLTMYWQYRYRLKEKNYEDQEKGIKLVLPHIEHKFRCRLGYTLHDMLSLRTTIEFHSLRPEKYSASNGFMLSQAISYTFQQLPLQFSVNYGFFDTSNYFSGITIYEKGLLYAFSMPSFYGQGMRFSMYTRYDFNKKLTAVVKIATTQYTNREEIGSGLEQIQGNSKTDLYLQLRYKF